MSNEKPLTKFRAGQITATIWENKLKKDKDEFVVHSITINKSYKKGDEWKTTDSYSKDDLPKVQLVAQKSYEYLSIKTKKDEE